MVLNGFFMDFSHCVSIVSSLSVVDSEVMLVLKQSTTGELAETGLWWDVMARRIMLTTDKRLLEETNMASCL